jgi:tetratricopeptide (TPR) repeat protein
VFEASNCPFHVHSLSPLYDLWNNPLNQADFLHLLALADLVQTSSSFLEEAFRPYASPLDRARGDPELVEGSRIVVFLNQLAKVPSAIPTKPDSPLVIGWAGSLSHVADIAHVARPVSKWVADHAGAVLHVMSDPQMQGLFALPPEKLRFFPWGSMDAYEDFLKGVHVGLAPLDDTPFNRGRSDVKWLEYAAQGCVFVGQRLPTYATVADGKTGFLFDDTAALLRILDKLHQDRSLLESVSRAAFDHITQTRRYGIDIKERAKIYKELLERRPPADAPPCDLAERSRFPRPRLPAPLPNYVPIKLGADDQEALREIHSHRPHMSGASVRHVEQRYGEFHLTYYARALIAAARGDFTLAEQYLRRSLGLYPACLAALQLLGDILRRTRRLEEARRLLLPATRWHSAYAPIYRQLIGIAEQQADLNSAIALAKEWEERCFQDPRARLIRALLLTRSGRVQEGMDLLAGVLDQFKGRPLAFAAELPRALQQAEPLASGDPHWPDLIMKAAELFPQGLWLAARAGVVYFERGQFEQGARSLQQARERLDALEWQRIEGLNIGPEYRRTIDFYRMACDPSTSSGSPRAPSRGEKLAE